MNGTKELTPHVFIVDDDEGIRKSLTRLMVLEGFTSESFDSARSFLDSVPTESKGCLILDVYMPDMDGFSLYQKMRQLDYHLPVIYITGHARCEDRDYALDHGALGFLQKMFDEKSLLTLVRRAMSESEN